MDHRATIFVGVMVGLALVAALGFAVLMIAHRSRAVKSQSDGPQAIGPRGNPSTPPPVAIALAIVLLLAAAAVLIWQLPEIMGPRGAGTGWSLDGRSAGFLIAMLVVAVIALVAFAAFMFVRWSDARPVTGMRDEPATGDGPAEARSGARLLGLLALGLAILLLCWTYLPAERQYALMLHLVYPTGFAVAAVLMFDKATRSWSGKSPPESVREWLMCDLFVFLLVLGYLNLQGYGNPDKYKSALWDILHVALFFAAFWFVDRRQSRFRFLVGYGYLIALPVLLMIWRATQGVVGAPEGVSWWETRWPFFSLAVVFFVLEGISLVAARESRTVGTAKDAIFVGLYAILLLIAIPGETG